MKTNPTSLRFSSARSAGVMLLASLVASHAGGKVAAWGDSSHGQTTLPNGLNNVRAIAAGSEHSLGLRADGTVVGWGWNDDGQATPPPLADVVTIAAGGSVSLALRADGSVAAWGDNTWGQTNVPAGLGPIAALAVGGSHCLALRADGTIAVWGGVPGTETITNVPAGLSGVRAVAAGGLHSLALKADGTVTAWGHSIYGQTNVPAGLSNVVAIAAAFRHSLALRADGTVVAWGYGFSGQTNVPAGLTDVIAIAAGDSVNLALRSDGTLVSWGGPYYGATNLPPGIAKVTGIACGWGHSLALVADGPPEILSQPANLAAPFQSNITFSVTATGAPPLAYRWFRDGAALGDSNRVSGAANTALTIANGQFSDAGRYFVIVSNAFGVVQSTSAWLTVTSPPIISLHPLDRTNTAGADITLLATAIGTPPLAYQWQFNGTPLDGATTTRLSLTNLQSNLAGNYSVLVSNTYGIRESSNALVTVLERAPYIITPPATQLVYLGNTASFSVTARGTLPLRYQWRFNGVDLPGATNSALAISPARPEQSGYYSVAISNTVGGILSAKANLAVWQLAQWGGWLGWSFAFPVGPPPELADLTAIALYDYLLGINANGNLVSLGGSPPVYAPPGLSNIVGVAAGGHEAVALKSNGTVTVFAPTPASPSYYKTNAPAPAGLSNVIAVAAGFSHYLALKSDGEVVSWGPYGNWYNLPAGRATNVPAGLSNVIAIAAREGQSLALTSDGRVTAWGNSTNVPATLSNVIAISAEIGYNLALRDDGQVVAWANRVASFRPTRFSVNTNVPPSLSNVVAIAAGYHALALQADGNVVTWGDDVSTTPAGLSNVFAIASGAGGLAALVSGGSPHFTIQPVGRTVAAGATARLHARAAGVQPLRYQWQHDGADLPGETNGDLTITDAHGRDTGGYQVVVSNALGVALSSMATLTIPYVPNLAGALNPSFVWTNIPTGPGWFAQVRESHDGDMAAQSGRISHGQHSDLETTLTGPGTLSFWWKVSSEEGFDRLSFKMDTPSALRAISGETDWEQVTLPIPAGAHQVSWVYAKDISVSVGQDAGWVDEVVFTPAAPLLLDPPRLLPDGRLAFRPTDSSGDPLLAEDLAFVEFQASTNLRDWVSLTGACTLTNGTLILRDPDCVNLPSRFYRTVIR